jgi:hypothetical protein
LHALRVVEHKVAIIFPIARLPAAHWIQSTPLRRVWLLSPRPSMPPGHYLAAGKRAKNGKKDFCWLIFEQGFNGSPEVHWLYRDGKSPRRPPTAPAGELLAGEPSPLPPDPVSPSPRASTAPTRIVGPSTQRGA